MLASATAEPAIASRGSSLGEKLIFIVLPLRSIIVITVIIVAQIRERSAGGRDAGRQAGHCPPIMALGQSRKTEKASP